MNNNFREGLNALREISDPEKMKMALEKITGKKLADYEGIDALVGALMGYYNDEVKKKQNIADNTLKTTAKEIVPAINEINQKIEGNSIIYTDLDITTDTNQILKFRIYKVGDIKIIINKDTTTVYGFYGGEETFASVIPKEYRPTVDCMFVIGESYYLNLVLKTNGDIILKKNVNQQNQKLLINLNYI